MSFAPTAAPYELPCRMMRFGVRIVIEELDSGTAPAVELCSFVSALRGALREGDRFITNDIGGI